MRKYVSTPVKTSSHSRIVRYAAYERHRRLVHNAAVRQAGTSNAAVVTALGDAAIGTRGSGLNSLPDDLAIVAETEK